MDPYLEDPAFWEDFHRRFITGLADYLLERLPDTYDAHIDERVRLVESEQGSEGTRLPDVSVDRKFDASTSAASPAPGGATGIMEPIAVPMAMLEEHRDVWIEIVHLPERQLVTAIEVFSPTNKEGEDAADYHAKRLALYSRHVNLVEIDLLRGGERLSFAKPLPPGDYYAFVTRSRERFVNVYAWALRDVLPAIGVPLQSPDPDVRLDLSQVFADAYKRGRYSRRLRYEMQLRKPISAADAAWAANVAAGRGKES